MIKCRMMVLVSGVAVKRNRELLCGRWDKHDTKAANIADLISQEKCLFQNRKQVLKMAGLDLSADRSGKPRIRRSLHFKNDLPKMTRIKYTVPGINILKTIHLR